MPVICKIVEVIIKERIKTKCDKVQNPLQRGFTRNASPMNAGLIVEEFLRDSKDRNQVAHLILLDAKAAFDMVNYEHLLRRLYHIGIQDKHLSLINSLHQQATSAVKWFGEQSTPFRVERGVRQGGILSADFYKVHLNPLLDRIQYSGLGARIGNITCNVSGCVDDLAVNTNDRREGQTLVNSATDFAGMERYCLQANKSVCVTVTPRVSKGDACCDEPLMMDGIEMKNTESAMHLGIHRATTLSKTSELNVDENLKKPEELYTVLCRAECADIMDLTQKQTCI